MNRLIIYFGILFFLLAGCKNESSAVASEIALLKTSAAKRAFLEEIYARDQEVRHRLNQQTEVFGYDSEEAELAGEQMMQQDAENLLKLENYLEKYPYPDKMELGRTAADTPWLVIHHSGSLSKSKEYFRLLYEAYLEGNIDDSQLSLYLGRIYTMKNGERLTMDGPYKSEDQINLLIKGLELEEVQAEVLEETNSTKS